MECGRSHWLTDFKKIIEYHNGCNEYYNQSAACACMLKYSNTPYCYCKIGG